MQLKFVSLAVVVQHLELVIKKHIAIVILVQAGIVRLMPEWQLM